MTFKKAKTNTRKLAAVTLSVAAGLATLAMPAAAQAQSYHNGSYAACKSADKDAQVVGGLLGAVVGGVLGSQVSGNGARTEGSVIGAVLGGAAGAGIGDNQRKCRTEAGYNGVRYNDRRTGTYERGYSPAPAVYRGGSTYGGSIVTVGHPGHNSHGTTNRSYRSNDRGYDRSYDRGYERGYDRRDNRLDRINFRIRETRQELERVKRKARYNGHRYTERRIYELGNELRRLKNKRKRIKRGYSEARRSSHYHGTDVCYVTH